MYSSLNEDCNLSVLRLDDRWFLVKCVKCFVSIHLFGKPEKTFFSFSISPSSLLLLNLIFREEPINDRKDDNQLLLAPMSSCCSLSKRMHNRKYGPNIASYGTFSLLFAEKFSSHATLYKTFSFCNIFNCGMCKLNASFIGLENLKIMLMLLIEG